MANSAFKKHIQSFKVPEGKKVKLSKLETAYDPAGVNKDESELILKQSVEQLSLVQDKLYAYNRYSILIIFQAMDAAGKDGAVSHVMSGLNPQGVRVSSFKVPSSEELDHDYFWRHYKELPARGEIGIFNRSHYENVLVTKVHPEYVLGENLPAVQSVEDMDKDFWNARYKQINRFEKNISENGTIILKFFLHLGKEEQKRRFIERIDNPKKNWKFSTADLKERMYWDKYQEAYEELLQKTSTDYAPWFVIPADNKWSARLAISEIILQEFESLKIHYPKISKAQKEELLKAKEALMNEK
ncbi:polyphosphate kinase 2 family protein [Rurimicrobium arvi]|uniref:Polyphosphate kinase 2 family protein n=1 Tax=Rurimicrobium arvi TaxID=2049916 RepID=A0ABP8MF20_9BACT